MTNFSLWFRMTKSFLNQQYFHTIEVCLEQCFSLILLFLFHFGFETPLGSKSFGGSFFSAMFSSSKKKAGNSECCWDDEQLHPIPKRFSDESCPTPAESISYNKNG